MARVNLLDKTTAPTEISQFFANGDPGPIPSSLANVADLTAVALPFIGRSLGPSTIPYRTKEIVILRASARLACRYCTQTHSVVALDAGLGLEEVAALRGERSIDSAFKEPSELALIAWTDVISDGAAPIGGEAMARLREHFSEAEVVEVTMTACTTILLNRYATALDLPVAEAHAGLLAEHGW